MIIFTVSIFDLNSFSSAGKIFKGNELFLRYGGRRIMVNMGDCGSPDEGSTPPGCPIFLFQNIYKTKGYSKGIQDEITTR